ncbi:glyoxalase superfamily protein [Actinoplanes sp. NPDC051470]|uniref:glyoxalase superfamily protein n=1 Tax=Actinoplanes sp. NPDC051470 TaxID=3157224 RepID=UPI00343BEDE4
MRTFRDAKTMAKTLRSEVLARTQADLPHSAALEIVARQFGFDDWNVLAARIAAASASRIVPAVETSGPEVTDPRRATTSTIPVLRIFAEERALEFYVEFLGFTLDFGGPAGGPDTSFYGQIIRGATTFQLSEQPYDPGAGATVVINIDGLDELRDELRLRYSAMGSRVWGPAVWVPEVQEMPWQTRVMTISDPFGNHLRFSEPLDPAARAGLPRWAPGITIDRRSR